MSDNNYMSPILETYLEIYDFFSNHDILTKDTIQTKKDLICKYESNLSNDDFLIFYPPYNDRLYTDEELIEILAPLKDMAAPRNLSTVQKSHWFKYKVIELMGYKEPSGLRIKSARKNKPKFLNQLLDIFAQQSSNLQVWNYIPYDENILDGDWNTKGIRYSDCRYLIIRHDSEGKVLNYFIKKGHELAKWDATGTKTIKWQANAPLSLRKEKVIICRNKTDPIFDIFTKSNHSTEEKIQKIKEIDKKTTTPLIKERPDSDLLFTTEELCKLILPVLEMTFPNMGPGKERVMGQNLEKTIASCLGYSKNFQTDTGEYPDLLHQLLEIKFQDSGTIDLGRDLPTDPKSIDTNWNKWNVTNEMIRYCICLVDTKEKECDVQSIVIVSGKDFPFLFNICAGTNFKVQLPIPKDEFEGKNTASSNNFGIVFD